MSVCLSKCLPVCLSACLPVCRPQYFSVLLSDCLSIHSSVCQFVSLPADLSVCLSVCLSVDINTDIKKGKVYIQNLKQIHTKVYWDFSFFDSCPNVGVIMDAAQGSLKLTWQIDKQSRCTTTCRFATAPYRTRRLACLTSRSGKAEDFVNAWLE